MAAPFRAAWANTPCRGSGPAADLVGGPNWSTIGPTSRVRRLPYIGRLLAARIGGTVQGLLRRFRRMVPLTTDQLHVRISHLLRNSHRNRCVDDVDTNGNVTGHYQVSDTNMCAFNSVVQLLQFAHQHWDGYNIPNAQHVALRTRGDNQEVRRCACQPSRAACVAFGECRWTPPNQTRVGVGACTPRDNNAAGFSGYSTNDRYDQHTNQVAGVRAQRAGNLNNGGGWYVRQWRVLPPPARRRGRRRRRNQGGRRLHACGTGGAAATIAAPNKAWSDSTKRAWARAVVDRFKQSRTTPLKKKQ